MSEEVAVAFENVELLGWRLLVVATIWPGSCGSVGVFRGEIQGS
jgi:hypothetical protein